MDNPEVAPEGLEVVELRDGRVTVEGSPEVLRHMLEDLEELRTGFIDLPEANTRACLEVERTTKEALEGAGS
ncbi:MAG TPA: hypothetical protein VF746_32195 [Longimicrobium sp.]|jgi:hypothetical protein